jgi:hypothetical protein
MAFVGSRELCFYSMTAQLVLESSSNYVVVKS